MPGIYKTFKTILRYVKDYGHVLNYVVPGLGTASSAVASLADKGTDAINNIHTGYTNAKKLGKKYKFLDGLRDFGEGFIPAEKPSPMKVLAKDVGELDQRIELKE
jgi:hypothetical protein